MEIVPEQAEIVHAAFEHYKANVSQNATMRYIRETYDLNWCLATLCRILRDRLYTGHYERGGRVNPNFCPAIIEPDLFEAVQQLLSVNVKHAPSGRIYLFSSLLVCDECGHKLTVQIARNIVYYRCPHYSQRALCTHNHGMPEPRLEEWLFEHLGGEVERCRAEWELKEAERKRTAASIDRGAIKRKLSKLKDLYVRDAIDLNEYLQDYNMYTSMLAEDRDVPQGVRPNFEAAKAAVSQDARTTYDGLSREEKRSLWHSVIREIRINNSLEITRVDFL